MAQRTTGKTSVDLDPSMRIVVLYGEERFLIEEFTRQLAEQLQSHFGGVEQFHFDGETAEPAAVLDELRSYGLMQKHKLVILDQADSFLAGGGKGATEDDDDEEGSSGRTSRRPLMERYAENPVPDATLLMRAALWRKGKLDKLIAKRGVIHECAPFSEAKAADWCMKRCAKRYETTIEQSAAELLVSRLGPALLHLDIELQKLAAMAGPGVPITRKLVGESVGLSREEKAWEIQSAVVSGHAPTMLRKLRELLDVSRQDEVPITWAICDVLRKLHAASHLLRRGVGPQGVTKQLRLWGAMTEPFLRIAKRTEPGSLAQLLRMAIQTDVRTKTGVGDPQRGLEALLAGIADKLNG